MGPRGLRLGISAELNGRQDGRQTIAVQDVNGTTVPNAIPANTGAAIVEIYPATSAEPVRAPAVNIFGEIDGQQPKGKNEPGDFGFR